MHWRIGVALRAGYNARSYVLRELPMRNATIAAGLLASFVLMSAAQAQTVLVTGSNRGIGLEFAKQYADRGWTVIATHRRDTTPDTLAALEEQYPAVRAEKLDVTDHASIDALAEKLAGMPIDVLINNAGITGDFTKPKPQTLGTLDYDMAVHFFRTNALGALKVSEAFMDNVEASDQKKIVAVSSLAGSFEGESGGKGGIYWYRSSKAALNMMMVGVAADSKRKGVTVALLSPGTVKVEKVAEMVDRMGLKGFLEPPESIAGMIDVIENLAPEDSGAFIRYNGEPQPF
ncbi:MAG: SDR family oxidoreductase [Gammaproteobacteria bacterium]|nr:SDR family oxidoreductase [Gammaproteobacteria bacterium]MYL02306.1 SDR family oxidoreductase [Gammaproteobacteria bacterium]